MRRSSMKSRYHRLAPTSTVDESLFGSPNPVNKSSELDKRGHSSKAPENQTQTLQIITKDLIRTIRIPSKDASQKSLILPSAEFERITSVLTKEEKEAQRKAAQRKKEEDIRAAEEMKRQIIEKDLLHKKNQPLSDLELKARDDAQLWVERAKDLRMEEEDEIKKLNKLILDVKCQAICDDQIQEKKHIQDKFAEEEKRLDAMMEAERRKALEAAERIDELRKQQRIRGRQEICDQICNRLEEKMLQDEMKELEKQQMREKQEKMNLQDLKSLEKKKEEQERLQEEIRRYNEETIRAKEQREEEEKLADMRNMEYMRKKMEREAEYEAEQNRIKKEKELEIATLRARQERAKDNKAAQNELHARRNQEIADREWRRKERELRVKKEQEKALLKVAREEQVQRKERLLLMEAGREKAECERILKVQQEALNKLREEEEKQRQKALSHAEALRLQVKERVLSDMTKRREVFTENDRLMEEARRRRAHLDEIREKKLKELKATGISEKYCSGVERKVHGSAL